MFEKFTKQYTNDNSSVIDEISKFQKKMHTSSMIAIMLMKSGIVPDSDAAKEKAMLTHEISHAIKNILSGMPAHEAIDKMTEDNEEED